MADEIQYGSKLFPVAIFGFDEKLENVMFIDASTNEGHVVESEITLHPVEFGANVSDHGIVQPRTFTLSGFVSAVDLKNRGGILDGATYRGHAAWTALVTATQQKTPLTIETNLEIYEGFLLKSLRTDQNWRNSLSLEFEAVFQEVIIVTTSLTEAEASNPKSGDTEEQFSPQVDRGVQATPEHETFTLDLSGE